LLDVFWHNHNPATKSWSRQYASIIFYRNDQQKRIAEESRAQIESERNSRVFTDIGPYTGFTRAEDYHQKHALQRYPEFMNELRSVYPSYHDFVDSTAVTHVNGYLGGDGTIEDLENEIDSLGLSPARQTDLRAIVRMHSRSLTCPTR